MPKKKEGTIPPMVFLSITVSTSSIEPMGLNRHTI
jgi:hypothetical protein